MASLLELVERINKGELIEAQQLEVYQDSANSAEKFLANHAHAMLDLRRSHTYLKEALEAINYADQKVLFQFLSVLGFLGLNDQRCEPVIRFGNAAIQRREIGLAMEAIQSGILQDFQHGGEFTRDRDNAKTIADHYDRCAQSLNWIAPGPRDWQNPQLKVGYVTTSIADDDACARMIGGLSKHFDPKQIKLHVYTTEATVRREKQAFAQGPFTAGSGKRGKETIDQLGRRKVSVWFGPLDQDLAGGARELANQIFRDQIDVLIIDTQSNDPVAAVLSGWTPAKTKLHIVRRSPVLSGETDGTIYFDAHRFAADKSNWALEGTSTHLLCEGVEPVTLETPAPQRSTFGIPDQSILLATLIQDGDETVSHDFMDAVVHTLRAHPAAVLLVAGDGDTAPLKRRLEAAGLAKRGGFVGKRKDLTDFLRMSDIYLAPFPSGHITGTLAAMAAGRPVVAMVGDNNDPHAHQELLGESTLPSNGTAYAARIDRFIREPALRAHAGDILKQRVAAHFAMERTADAVEALCRTLVRPAPQEHAPQAQAA